MGTLSGWLYRKAITVNHTDDGAQTNYQMELSVIKGAGVDSTGVVYLGNHALNWPTDIQITASDGTTAVDFWREESDATDGTWWIECPTIAAGGTWTGYIYYGKVDAADASSGANTFLFFDDFPGVALDTVTNWTVTQGNTPTVASSICTIKCLSTVRSDIVTKTTWGTNHAIRAYLKSKHFASTSYYEAFGWAEADQYPTVDAEYCNITAASNGKYCPSGGTYVAIQGWVADTYAVQDMIRNGATNIVCKVDNGNKVTLTDGLNNGASMGIYTYVYSKTNSELNIDWVLVRNCTLNEPTWAASGAEEALSFIPYENPIFQLLVR